MEGSSTIKFFHVFLLAYLALFLKMVYDKMSTFHLFFCGLNVLNIKICAKVEECLFKLRTVLLVTFQDMI